MQRKDFRELFALIIYPTKWNLFAPANRILYSGHHHRQLRPAEHHPRRARRWPTQNPPQNLELSILTPPNFHELRIHCWLHFGKIAERLLKNQQKTTFRLRSDRREGIEWGWGGCFVTTISAYLKNTINSLTKLLFWRIKRLILVRVPRDHLHEIRHEWGYLTLEYRRISANHILLVHVRVVVLSYNCGCCRGRKRL